MNLDKMTVNIKPLTAYQAMDLGMAVARTWYGQLWRLWWQYNAKWLVLLFLMSAGLYYWGVSQQSSMFFYLLPLWWCKPLLERPLMIYLSHKLFDEHYHIQDVTRDSKTLPKSTFMLLRRPSLRRAMVVPIFLLEGQNPKNARGRLQVLIRHQDNAVVFHNLVFFVAEMAIWMVGVLVLLWLFGIDVQTETWQQSTALMVVIALIELIGYMLVVALLTPFFVASGFMMYLCKRSLLEGWDIELVFRQLAYRHHQEQHIKSHQSAHKGRLS